MGSNEGTAETRVIAAPEASMLHVDVPGSGYHRDLVSCQRACPVHTDARGYVRAIAAGRFEEAYLIARGPNPFASICGRICGLWTHCTTPMISPACVCKICERLSVISIACRK